MLRTTQYALDFAMFHNPTVGLDRQKKLLGSLFRKQRFTMVMEPMGRKL